jgi:hypothetical protein
LLKPGKTGKWERQKGQETRGPKMLVLLTGILSILGVIAGYFVKLLSDLFIKHQTRLNTLEKLIIEKRLYAYEEIIGLVREASIGIADGITDNKIILQSSILDTLERFDGWLTRFIAAYSRNTYLIDYELDYKIRIFMNYIANLDQVYFTKIRTGLDKANNAEQLEREKRSRIGRIVYDDFRKLSSDIVGEASKFYSTGIFRRDFRPSTIGTIEYIPPMILPSLLYFLDRERSR